ncbi:hypothetical protein [Halobacillus sp. K22]|uniref:hypothetical protein n=1 Tax=Halobacillus sp. K22 TaxID=3457431 RepID=UPI003FCC870A
MRNTCYVQDNIAIIEVVEDDRKHKVIIDICFLPLVLEGSPEATYEIEREKKKSSQNQHGTYYKKGQITGVFKRVQHNQKVYLKNITLNPDSDEQVHTIESPLNLTFSNLLLTRN